MIGALAMRGRIDLSDEDLLASGDSDDFAAFYGRHARPLLGYFVRRTRDPHVAADLAAETFAAALAARARYDPATTKALAWLYTIAGRRLADHRRRGAVETRMRQAVATGTPRGDAEDAAILEVLAEDAAADLLSALPADQRDAVTAHVIHDRGYPELAHDLRTSEAAVRQRVSRGLVTLRRRLGVAAVLAALVAILGVIAARQRTEPVPAAPKIAGELRLGGTPTDATRFGGALWIADFAGRRVVRVDPVARRVVERIPVAGQPNFIAAADDGGLWVHTGRSGTDMATLVRIDPANDRVTARTTVGPEGPMTVAGGFVYAAVWASDDNRPPAGLYRVDARSGRTLPRIPLTGVDDIAAAGRTVWALTSNGMLARLDARTGRVERRWPELGVAAGTAAGANALAAGADGVWVLSTPQAGPGRLVRVTGDRVDRELPLAATALPVLAAGAGGLWTAHGDDLRDRYRLTRLDPLSGRVTGTVSLGSVRPVQLVAVGDEVWVAGDDGRLLIVR